MSLIFPIVTVLAGVAVLCHKDIQLIIFSRLDDRKKPLNENFSYNGRIDPELTLKSLEVDNTTYQSCIEDYNATVENAANFLGKRKFLEKQIKRIENEYLNSPEAIVYQPATIKDEKDTFNINSYELGGFQLLAEGRNLSLSELVEEAKVYYRKVYPPHPEPRAFEQEVISHLRVGVGKLLYYKFLSEELGLMEKDNNLGSTASNLTATSNNKDENKSQSSIDADKHKSEQYIKPELLERLNEIEKGFDATIKGFSKIQCAAWVDLLMSNKPSYFEKQFQQEHEKNCKDFAKLRYGIDIKNQVITKEDAARNIHKDLLKKHLK